MSGVNQNLLDVLARAAGKPVSGMVPEAMCLRDQISWWWRQLKN